MKSIISLFWGICLLRQSPAAVPGQGAFVAIVVTANLLVSVGVSLSLAESPGVMRTVTGIVVGQAVTASLVWLVLAGRNLRARNREVTDMEDGFRRKGHVRFWNV